MKRRLKTWLGTLLYASGVYRPLFRGRAVVVAFHRVRDDLPGNPVTCTTREFREYCVFFRKYFRVVSLAELFRRLDAGEDVSRCLAITFDDGYTDNLEVVAPELQRLGLPACFFVATDYIGTARVPWWDEEYGVKTRWLTWEQVRALHSAGFEVGGHTCNHVDLGLVSGQEARAEIEGSRQRLQQELGTPVRFFSYPYGRRHQMLPENVAHVRAAGFDACFSAYGGSIRPGDDRFALLRTPVTPWHRSPGQLGYELAIQQRSSALSAPPTHSPTAAVRAVAPPGPASEESPAIR
jgi:peptidoglycan/xylan/chitin deacetylase (PgdA/CDA1 family)